MSMKSCSFIPKALVVSGMAFGLFLASPPAHAGEVMTLAPAEDRDVPEGSQIPERRVYETEMKVKAYKEKMRAERAAQQQESLPEAESAEPEAEKP